MLNTFLSLGIILLVGFILGYALNKIRIPGLVGMILLGIVIGPNVLNLLSVEVLAISSTLRKIALVIILTRSGLNLDIESLRKVGRPAILMCFLPATFEIIGAAIAGYYFFSLTIGEALVLGSVLAAVSPAVVSPRMIHYIEEGLSESHNVPKLVLAGASCDDIYVIVLFYAFLGIVQTNSFDASRLASIPVSIILGVLLGIAIGILLSFILKKLHLALHFEILITLSLSFCMIGLEDLISNSSLSKAIPWFNVSALLSIVVLGMVILFKAPQEAKDLSMGYNKLWGFFEIFLFVLVGAEVNVSYAIKNFGFGLLVLGIGLLFRMIGCYLCLIKTDLTKREKLFVLISYLPKATVQASIGGIALSMGLSCGEVILTVAVLSILITAPLGAILMDNLNKKLLEAEKVTNVTF